jgi:acyl-CoA thioesterase-2
MTVADEIDLLRLEPVGKGRFQVHQPAGSPEGGDVVFGGQLMAQTIMAADADAGGKYVKSLNTVFSRAGVYSEPIHITVEPFQSGRTFASDILTAWQGERLLTRTLAMLTSNEPDLIAHQLDRPHGVSSPDDGEPARAIVFPGAEARTATLAEDNIGGVPVMAFWTRMPASVTSLAANHAILAYATTGQFIELSMRPHRATVRIEDAHHTLTTGVVNHTMNFHREFDTGQWLLLVHEATFAGKGRVHGRGTVYTEDGVLVATFAQDSMVRPAGPTRNAPP